ncbi:MAG: prolyl oligopeptidase family serine peptidase [Salibacteraceae bacterium]
MNLKTKWVSWSSIAFTFLLFSCGGAPQPADNSDTSMAEIPTIPLEDFFKNPEKTRYTISPDGQHFAFMAPVNNETGEKRMNVFVQAVGEASAQQVTEVADRDIAYYFWANNTRLVYSKDFGGDENFALFAVDIDGNNFKELTRFEGVRTNIIDDLENQDEIILVGMNKRNPMVFDPYRMNIVTGEMEMVYENPGNIVGWQTDHDGKVRIAMASNGLDNSILYRKSEDEPFQEMLTTSYKESMAPLFFTFDNQQLYASSNLGRDKSAIVKFDPEPGKEVEVLFEHDEVDVSGLYFSNKRKVLTTISWTKDKRERKFLDAETEAMFKDLEEKLPGYEIGISSSDKAEENFIVRTYSDRSMGAYYTYNKPEGKLTMIEEVAPWLNEDNMAEMQCISYQSRDGLTIHGYLTVPRGQEAKNLPVVVNVHGGPWARDFWGYDPTCQFLANRGYAVLQMNFRGSTGYGRNFWEASFKEWGLKMQDDVTDGTQWLVDQGIADPNRIAIFGGSYGGYATLAGLTKEPELYACGIDYVGVSNLFTFMATIPPYWKPYLPKLHDMVGNPADTADSVRMTATSPVFHADKITAPLLIAQGAKDPRVNVDESDQMVAAMKYRGVNVQYLVEPEEGHGFRNEENRFKFYRAMEEFLNEHLGKAAAAEQATASR